MNTHVIKKECKPSIRQKFYAKKTIFFILTLIVFISFTVKRLPMQSEDYQFSLLIFIGFAASFLGTLAGGAALITIPAMMLTGIPIQTSIATNKFSSGIAAISSVFYLIQHKQLKAKAILRNVFIAFSGGICGALLTAQVAEQTMNIAAFFLLCFALLVTVKNKDWTSSIDINKTFPPSTKTSLYIPFWVAVYDGGFGPGSSTFSIIYYLKNFHNYMKAVQMTRVLILGSCTGGFIVFYQTGFINWSYAISMGIGSILGSQIGLLCLPKIPQKIAKYLLLSIIFLLIVQMFYKLFY